MLTIECGVANQGRRGPVNANEYRRKAARRDKRILIETAIESGCFGCGHIIEGKKLRSYRFRGGSHALCIECETRLYGILLDLQVKMRKATRLFCQARDIYRRSGAWPHSRALKTKGRKPRRRPRRPKPREPGILALEGRLYKPAII